MKIRLLLLLPALLAAALTHAQTFEPGLLVRANGDTLRGELENSFWREPPAYIHFRPAAGSASQLFRPRQLRAVSFAGGRYFRYEALPIDHAAETRLSDLPRGNHPDVRVDSLLAEVLVDGFTSLLRVVRPGATHYLICRAGRPVLDLSARRYLRQVSTGDWVATDGNNYRSQLELYFSDCPAVRSTIPTAAFEPEVLAAMVQAYNATCSPLRQPGRNWLAQATPKRTVSLQGGVLLGGRYNRNENLSYYAPATNSCVDCQVHPLMGLYAELFQASRTAALYGEFSVSPFRSQSTILVGGSNFPAANYTTFNYRGWRTTARLGARYFFPLPHGQQWFFTAGYELNFVSGAVITSATGPLNGNDIDKVNNAVPTLLPNLGLGWRAQRLSLGLDGQLYRDGDNSYWSNFVGHSFAVRMVMGYRLGQNPDSRQKTTR